ncbi:HPP family protein [Mangrovicoccus algicola]|uniref:HPP family protein n=1 Tax=Mangrovicoccus algicola TaxID=2771008 RepID=A0A8J7CUJ6_9RHOB|nr:HPP family protein [Mangrovicoccus algicola]MBE3637589.1 HPP family protein [Mangrovicoccus algicola]
MPPFLRALGPAVPQARPAEALRAGTGALAGLAVAGLAGQALAPVAGPGIGLSLIAPFGASSVLLFAAPSSPLAQPWPAVMGNTLAALVGVAVCLLAGDPVLRVALAVGLAIAVMLLCRAVHPPAGAVAMTAALDPGMVERLGFGFALAPVATGTVLLVGLAMIHARLTGRHYPMRGLAPAAGAPGPAPAGSAGLSGAELESILTRYRQSLNLGTGDLARLIGAAELQTAAHRGGVASVADIMSRDLVTVSPDTPLAEVVALFRRHRFASLPVTGPGGRFFGVIFQIHLIERAQEDAFRGGRGFAAAMRRLTDRRRSLAAADVMSVAGPRAVAATPVAALLPMMADAAVDAVPVLERGRLIGIATRSDIIRALARQSLAAGAAPRD